MADEPTCGQGLAQHADLPRLIAELMDSVAENLAAHLRGLTSRDLDTQRERRVYEQLAARHREAAEMLDAVADEMAGHRDMPMGVHDLDALSSGETTDALAGMVGVERRLLAHVERQLTEHEAMLSEMRAPGDPRQPDG